MVKKRSLGVTKKGDLYKIQVLTKKGHVQSRWVTAKTLKKYEAVFVIHKDKRVTAWVPLLKTRKPKPLVAKSGISRRPIRITIHVKVTYDRETVNKYLASGRAFHLEGVISTECFDDEKQATVTRLERELRERLGEHFCKDDPQKKLIDEPFYESGLESESIDEEPDRSIEAEAEYRYSPDGLYKKIEL